MKEILRVDTVDEANLVKAVLEGSGIDVELRDDEILSIHPLYSLAVGGVKILVDPSKEEDAIFILNAKNEQATDRYCPKCNSSNIRYRTIEIGTFVTCFLPFALPRFFKSIYCLDCLEFFNEKDVVKSSNTESFDVLDPEREQILNEVEEPERDLPIYMAFPIGWIVGSLIHLLLIPLHIYWGGSFPSFFQYLLISASCAFIGLLLKYSDYIRIKHQKKSE